MGAFSGIVQTWVMDQGWGAEERGPVRPDSLHLVEVVCASVVDVVAEGSSDHGQGLQISEVPLQLPCLEGYQRSEPPSFI